ncbi:glycosyltransferase family 4 protein [Mucilaginibacter terrae]|uniref:glycosyltransferase family 4 protein n=1 Tax=Mucilaginibacter terrae TaxID=1955052 RepID=UPI00362A8B21
MKVVISQLTGNANVKAAAYGFARAHLLAYYYVSLAVFPGNVLDIISKFGPLSEIRRRKHDTILQPYTKMWPWVELGRMIATKSGISSLTVPPTAPFYINTIVNKFDRYVASQLKTAVKKGATAVYGYEDTVLSTFLEAKKLGIPCLYDLPIGYWRSAHRLLDEERERWPEWIPTLTGLKDSEEKLARKDEELQLADQIFVASNFTATTLKEYPGKLAPIKVIPYGFPEVAVNREYSSPTANKPLKLLFVGGLSQRKGIADLFAAVDAIGPHVELTVVGSKKNDECVPLNLALTKHRWIPSLSHDGILKLMQEHDVLIFASLFEGFGLVITEAMSQGTPVITTDRTIGPNFIEHGKNGWLVKAGSTRALQDAIQNLLDHRNTIADVGRAAMETASKRSWDDYGNELAQAVMQIR